MKNFVVAFLQLEGLGEVVLMITEVWFGEWRGVILSSEGEKSTEHSLAVMKSRFLFTNGPVGGSIKNGNVQGKWSKEVL